MQQQLDDELVAMYKQLEVRGALWPGAAPCVDVVTQMQIGPAPFLRDPCLSGSTNARMYQESNLTKHT